MNNKELLIDFIEYAKSIHVMPILHSNIEPLVNDYLSSRNIGNTTVIRSRLSEGDKLICWAKGAAYGDTFTVQDPMYVEGMILQSDKYGSWTPLKDLDLSEYYYA